MYVIQARYSEAVFSHETAFYLLDLVNREPVQYTVTLKAGTNATGLTKQGVKAYKVKDALYIVRVFDYFRCFSNVSIKISFRFKIFFR
ncbi:MAG: hypothetical protein PVG90_11135 [Bacillota bacterium]